MYDKRVGNVTYRDATQLNILFEGTNVSVEGVASLLQRLQNLLTLEFDAMLEVNLIEMAMRSQSLDLIIIALL